MTWRSAVWANGNRHEPGSRVKGNDAEKLIDRGMARRDA